MIAFPKPSSALSGFCFFSIGPEGPVQDVTVEEGSMSAIVTVVDPRTITGPFTFDYEYYSISMPDVIISDSDVDSPFSLSGLQENVTYTITVSIFLFKRYNDYTKFNLFLL